MIEPPFTLKLSDKGDVVLLRGRDTIALGDKVTACRELCRFLSETDETDWDDGPLPAPAESRAA